MSIRPLIETVLRGRKRGLRYNLHPGQRTAWQSSKRFPLVLGGTQGGKTDFGPLWLHREIQQQGPGDYMVVTPTYPLLNLKAMAAFLNLFERILCLGTMSKAERVFLYHDRKTRVLFGHASEPESLEAATAKACWLDECGQAKFRLGSWEAIQRRLSIHQGRALLTTTPYNLGWIYQRLWKPWEAAGRDHPDIDVIRFESTMNPAFPVAEYERAQRELPRWKFDLFYRALFTRPAGLIYDCFSEQVNTCPPFTIPDAWPRYLGIDFGGTNTAAVFLAEHPTSGKVYCYREYGPCGGKTAAGHAAALLAGEPGIPIAAGGSASEDQWRDEFAAAGLPVWEPSVSAVEPGIDRVYGAFQSGRLVIFQTCVKTLDELGSYSREVDDMGEPTERIADKETYHLLDAVRYIVPAVVAPLRGGGESRLASVGI